MSSPRYMETRYETYDVRAGYNSLREVPIDSHPNKNKYSGMYIMEYISAMLHNISILGTGEQHYINNTATRHC